MPGPDAVDLYLRVDPTAATVQPSYAVTTGGVTGARTNLGGPVPIPASWVTGASGLAVGIIGTSFGATAFPASWDLIEVTLDNPTDLGTWQSKAPIPTARMEVSFVQAGGKMYLAGGNSTLHQAYDPSTNTWSTVAPLPLALDHFTGVTVGGRIYYIGGIGTWPTGSVGNVTIYDPSTNSFSSGAPMPRPRGAGGVVVYGGRIYYAGGLASGTVRPWFDVYDPVANTWTQLADMPAARHHFQPVVIGNRMYVIGGRLSSPPTGTVAQTAFAYDFITSSWSTIAPPPVKLADYCSAAVGSRMLIFGGHVGGSPLATVWSFDTATGIWSALTPMLAPRFSTQAVLWNGNVYIAGGGTANGAPTTRTEVFFPPGSSPPPPPPSSMQPDGTVRLQADSTALGDGVYNTTGTGQTRQVTSARGTVRWFVIRVQNDGTASDSFTLQAPGNSPGFVVHYYQGLSGTTDITSAVIGGTYTMSGVPPGSDQVIRLKVFVQAGATIGSTGSWLVTATSNADGTKKDAVRAQVTAS
jgi:N-acetylneuraminic acid mutarotase